MCARARVCTRRRSFLRAPPQPRRSASRRLAPASFPLSLGRSLGSAHTTTLSACATTFSSPTQLTGGNAWSCTRCRARNDSTLTTSVAAAARTLVVQLKRFRFREGVRDKVEADVRFPVGPLPLAELLPGAVEGAAGDLYELVAVCNHVGGTGGGHYTAYARLHTAMGADRRGTHAGVSPSGWYYCNDADVEAAREADVVSPRAYLLLYVRLGARGSEVPPYSPSVATCGLRNTGNTCYFASVLQCLRAVPGWWRGRLAPAAARRKKTARLAGCVVGLYEEMAAEGARGGSLSIKVCVGVRARACAAAHCGARCSG